MVLFIRRLPASLLSIGFCDRELALAIRSREERWEAYCNLEPEGCHPFALCLPIHYAVSILFCQNEGLELVELRADRCVLSGFIVHSSYDTDLISGQAKARSAQCTAFS